MWGALEVAIEDTVVGILCNEPTVLQGDAFAKVRVPLSEFETMEKDNRMRFLVSEFQRGQTPSNKRGITAFESLLEHVGLGGSVGEDLRKTIGKCIISGTSSFTEPHAQIAG